MFINLGTKMCPTDLKGVVATKPCIYEKIDRLKKEAFRSDKYVLVNELYVFFFLLFRIFLESNHLN